MQTVYSMENLRYILFYLVIPLLVLLIISFIILNIYKHKNKGNSHTSYVVSYWNNVLGVIITSMLLAVSIGFALAFVKTVSENNLIAENRFFYYFFMVFPAVPLVFLLYYISKFVMNVNNKEKTKKEIVNDEE